jgi:hypothetical protein
MDKPVNHLQHNVKLRFSSLLPDIRKGVALFEVSQASHAFSTDKSSIKMKISAGMIHEETEVLGAKKEGPMPRCSPQKSNELAQDMTRTSIMKGQRLSTCATTRNFEA